jgi:Protein of unknown function (DUF1579)
MRRSAPWLLLLVAACAAPPPSTSPAPVAPTLPGNSAQGPGPAHSQLAALEGDYAVTVTSPGRDAPVGEGSARLSSLHGGRFLRLEVQLELEGTPVRLTGHLGFDGASQEWQALWLSDLSTGMSLLRGRGQLEQGVHLRGEQAGVSGRSILRVRTPTGFSLATYGRGPDGRERLLRTSTYVRK